MSLFLRRLLQRYINDLDEKISRDATTRIVKALNGRGAQRLATEWEVVLLWGFTRRFHVWYEPGHANNSKLDLVVGASPTSQPLFSADVRSVSDAGYHKENQVDRFLDILQALKAEAQLTGEIRWSVAGDFVGEFRRAKVVLRLPRDEEAWNDLRARVRDFFADCARRRVAATLALANLHPGLTIAYDPRGRGFSGGYPSYVATYNIRRNPIANALYSKLQQIVRAGASGFRGIILCDGGCDLLHSRSAGAGALSMQDVVVNFLRCKPEVDFVVALGVESTYSPMAVGQRESHRIMPHFFSLLPESKIGTVYQTFGQILPLLPAPVESPANAQRWYAQIQLHEAYRRQSMKWKGNEVTVSARWLMELLSGRVSVEDAFRQYNITAQSQRNPFYEMLRAGRLPEQMHVIRNDDADDDAITITFGKADASVSPFAVPQGGVRPGERQ